MSQKTVKRQKKQAVKNAANNGAAKTAVEKPPLQVPYDLADKILGYLGTKPYQEVATMVSGLMRCAPRTMRK